MKRATVFFCLLAATVCVAQVGGDQELRSAMGAGNQSWMEGMKRGDAAMVAASYAEFGMNCTVTGECVVGRAAVEQQYRMRLGSLGPARTATVTTSSVVRDRDLAYEWGFVEARFADGQAMRSRYLTVWQRQGQGTWQIYRRLALPTFRPPRELAGPAAEPYVLRCESNDMNYRTCAGRGEIDSVEVRRQISGTECVQDRTFGWKGSEVWVNRGCRAEFTVVPYVADAGFGRPYGESGRTMSLKCESGEMNYRFCAAGGVVRGARVSRQISGSPCDEKRTWGWKSDGVWVDKGCRAEFEVVLQ